MQTLPAAAPVRPPIILSDYEADTLSTLAMAAGRTAPLASRMLLEEIERAQCCSRDQVPDDVVSMGSTVTFVDEAAGTTHEVSLVYPADADADAKRISILTPLGAGLIGLRSGESISWPNRLGQHRSLRIVAVRHPEDDAR